MAAALEQVPLLDPFELRREAEQRFSPERMVDNYLVAYERHLTRVSDQPLTPATTGRRLFAALNRASPHHDPNWLLRLELFALARSVLSLELAPEPVARVLRGVLRNGRAQRDLLPASQTHRRRSLGGDHPRRFLFLGQGQPLPHPCSSAP
jgi:hypothetical protein